jgi:hypothetical protein
MAMFVSGILSVTPGLAETVNNVRPTSVGNQESQLYVNLESVPPGCRGVTLYHSSENQAGQNVMAILLAARLAKVPISRIDYVVRADGSCWMVLVEV